MPTVKNVQLGYACELDGLTITGDDIKLLAERSKDRDMGVDLDHQSIYTGVGVVGMIDRGNIYSKGEELWAKELSISNNIYQQMLNGDYRWVSMALKEDEKGYDLINIALTNFPRLNKNKSIKLNSEKGGFIVMTDGMEITKVEGEDNTDTKALDELNINIDEEIKTLSDHNKDEEIIRLSEELCIYQEQVKLLNDKVETITLLSEKVIDLEHQLFDSQTEQELIMAKVLTGKWDMLKKLKKDTPDVYENLLNDLPKDWCLLDAMQVPNKEDTDLKTLLSGKKTNQEKIDLYLKAVKESKDKVIK